MDRYVDFIVTKRGLSNALQSDSAAYAALPDYFYARLRPALASLLQTAVEAQVIRPGFEADELLRAAATLCKANPDEDPAVTKQNGRFDGGRAARRHRLAVLIVFEAKKNAAEAAFFSRSSRLSYARLSCTRRYGYRFRWCRPG
jgi:hypothetical protein